MDFLNKPLIDLTDSELMGLLDATSEEVKRRNHLLGTPLMDFQGKSPEENVQTIFEALNSLGIRIETR